MKKRMNTNYYLGKVFLHFCLLTITLISFSCTDVGRNGIEEPSGEPELLTISLAKNDSLVSEGSKGQTYILRGKHLKSAIALYVNGHQTGFNTNHITEGSLFFSVDDDTPTDETATNKIRLETLGGVAEMDFRVVSLLKEFELVVYHEGTNWSDDFLADGWQNWSWGTNFLIGSDEVVKTGDTSWKVTYDENWVGLQLGGGSTDLSGFEVIELSIFPSDKSTAVNIVLNGDWGNPYTVNFNAASWNEITIPLSHFGSPGTMETFIMQEASNNGQNDIVLYIDEFGFN